MAISPPLFAAPALALALAGTPNIDGAWTPPAGTGQFELLHRFEILTPAGRAGTNNQAFNFSGGLTDRLAAGLQWTTQSHAVPILGSELEVYAGQQLWQEADGAPLSIGAREAYNAILRSLDGELTVARTMGSLQVLGTARVLGSFFGSNTQRAAAGLGASWALTPDLKLAADASYVAWQPLKRSPTEGPLIWGAGVQLNLPESPHGLSLHVGNAASNTIHGSAAASDALMGGLSFSTPFGVPKAWRQAASPEPPAASPLPGTDAPEALPRPVPTPRPLGAAKAFFASKCIGCHARGGTGGFGPDLRKVEAKGDAFIVERIMKGSPKGMPPFDHQLSSVELGDLVEYVKGL